MTVLNRLSLYNADLTQQDYDLLQFVINRRIDAVKYLGDCSFLQSIIKRESSSPVMCIFLVNHPFKFSEIFDTCNKELKNLPANGFFYLAINKFFAIHEPHHNLADDYDDAIYEHVNNNIKYPIIKYYSGKDDYGQKFNWGHPLTRFYFSNASAI